MEQYLENNEFGQINIPGILQSINILIAEDNEANFFLIKKFLEPTKANIKWAKNGKEAAEMVFSDNSINIVIMDILMPVMNGFDSLKLIKSKYPELPVIALTCYMVSGDRDRGLKEGFSDYLLKPSSKKIIIDSILKFTSK